MTANVTNALRSARLRIAGRPWLTDLALGGGLTTLDVATLAGRDPAPGPLGLLLWGLQTVPLFWRRRHPVPVLLAMTVAFVVFEVSDPVSGKTPGPYFLIFAVYAIARYAPVEVSASCAVLSLVAAVTTDIVSGRFPPFHLGSVEPITATTFVAFFSVAWLLGYGRRRIDRDAERLRDLNDRLRAEQEINARQAVLTERARIARDLHDVVAHHVSAIAVQARSTEDVMQDDPGLGLRGVTRIAETADTALIEMRRILGLLSDEEVGPEPSLHHVARLVEAAEAAGCRVTTVLDDALTKLSFPIQISAYRIAQEALTNVLKHAGPTAVRIALRLDAEALTIEIENGPPAAGHRPVPGSGRGLIGVRERAMAFDGTLDTGPTSSGGWRLCARLPLGDSR
jgi:signal transduction histidine kinase